MAALKERLECVQARCPAAMFYSDYDDDIVEGLPSVPTALVVRSTLNSIYSRGEDLEQQRAHPSLEIEPALKNVEKL